MSDDLVSLRMLVVGAARPEQELWRRAAALASVPIQFETAEANSFVAVLTKSGADICVLDADLPDGDKTKVITAARAVRPVPLVFVSSPNGSVRHDGIDGMLKKPADIDDARMLAEICVRAKIPTQVLIVDDSGTMRSIVRKILSASHFKLILEEATEGQAALDQMRVGNYDIVFLDYNMPGLNGLETLAEIKRESPKVAVVLMTSTLDAAIADRANDAGAFAFLKKPFYPADINAILARYYGLALPMTRNTLEA